MRTSSDIPPTEAANIPYLPPEIQQEIVAHIITPIVIRGHALEKLLQQQHVPSKGQQDQIIRRDAASRMDKSETKAYREMHAHTLNLSLVSRDFQRHALSAEKTALEASRPMDLDAFKAFCADPSLSSATEVVLEWLPPGVFDELAKKPLDGRTTGPVNPGLIGLSRATLAMVKDKIMPIQCELSACARITTWHVALGELPEGVRKVTCIVKMPDVPGLSGTGGEKLRRALDNRVAEVKATLADSSAKKDAAKSGRRAEFAVVTNDGDGA